MIYRIVVQIPSEIFVEVDSLEDARTFIQWVAANYDQQAYPISSQSDDRSGIATVKVLSIEPASASDNMTGKNTTQDAMQALKDINNTAESDGEPPEGPNAA